MPEERKLDECPGRLTAGKCDRGARCRRNTTLHGPQAQRAMTGVHQARTQIRAHKPLGNRSEVP